jgi:hypothetical protein
MRLSLGNLSGRLLFPMPIAVTPSDVSLDLNHG